MAKINNLFIPDDKNSILSQKDQNQYGDSNAESTT